MTATSLDHVGWATRDPLALDARFEQLGFCLTPRSTLSGPLLPGTPAVPWGAANRCAMLRDGGYLQLLGITDPTLPLNGLDHYLDRYEGLHIVVLGMENAEADHARLCRAALPVAEALPRERPVSDEEPDGPRIRVRHLMLPEAPEGRLQLIQHLTPELLWQERFLDHPNRAVALEAAILAVESPAGSAARFSCLAGRPVVPDPLGGFALPLSQGTVRLLPPEALPAVLPGVVPPTVPFIAAAVVRVDDGGRAVRAILGADARETPGGLLAEAGGGWILFTW